MQNEFAAAAERGHPVRQFINETFVRTRSPRPALPTRLRLAALCGLALGFAACPAFRGSATEALFLADGALSAFDGKQTRNVQLPAQAAVAQSGIHHLFDSRPRGAAHHFLISKGFDARFRPDSDAPAGVELWLVDTTGAERRLHPTALRAKFSPTADAIAYTTSDADLRVEDLRGKRLVDVRGAYNPSWRGDGRAIVFEKVPAGRPAHLPETLHLATLDVASGQIAVLTDGEFDDVRPEFHPSGKWILFVSGGRSGLASFWRVDAKGGEPEQVTNIGLKRIDDTFVPTPYQRTIWSADGRWFLYDFKSGDVRQVRGLAFEPSDKLARAVKLADGLNPQWLADGKTFAYLKLVGESEQPALGRLP